MSTVFLFGNGFDLSCGIKSKYTDMYKGYCQIKETDSKNIQKFKQKILNEKYEKWSDFEITMSEYASEFKDENEFLECVRDFKRYLINYLKEEQEKFHNTLITNNVLNISLLIQEEMKRSLDTFYKDITPNLEMQVSKFVDEKRKYISFNYTNILSNLLRPLDQSTFDLNFVQIHGNLEKDVVLGIDNNTQCKANFVSSNRFSKSFIKTEFNKSYDSFRVFKAEEFIKEANIICSYGLSLGDTDLTWRNNVIQQLKKNKDCHLFIFNYDLIKQTGLLTEEQMFLEEETKHKLLEKWKVNDSQEIFERIHMPCGKQLFCINKIIEETKKNSSNGE